MFNKITLIILLVYSLLTIPAFPLDNIEDNYPGFIMKKNTYFIESANYHVEYLKSGNMISLNSLIIMPRMGVHALLIIEFPRETLTDEFINDIFLKPNEDIVRLHPFSDLGVEIILDKKQLTLIIHCGVILHLRNDIQCKPDYKIFKNENVTGKVREVEGTVLYSHDVEIKANLKDVYSRYVCAKGKTTVNPKNDFPECYPPVLRETQ